MSTQEFPSQFGMGVIQTNAAGDCHIHFPTAPRQGTGPGDARADAGDPDAPLGSTDETGTAGDSGLHSTAGTSDSGGVGCIFAVIAVVIGLIWWVSSGSSAPAASSAAPSFPAKSDPWPAGATTAGILAPVTSWLANCAEEVRLSPVNCPQTASASTDQVSGVRWTLHGNAGDGAVISYKQGKFWVFGHAVMTVTYNSGTQWDLDAFGYLATVSWNDGHPSVESPPQAISTDSGPRVVKHDPRISMAEASALVTVGFKQCAALKATPLPEQCMGLGQSGDNATWTLVGNPVLNATESFDPSTGLVHVKGNFVLTDSYHVFLLGHQTDNLPGTYDAALSMDGTRATLVGITQD